MEMVNGHMAIGKWTKMEREIGGWGMGDIVKTTVGKGKCAIANCNKGKSEGQGRREREMSTYKKKEMVKRRTWQGECEM